MYTEMLQNVLIVVTLMGYGASQSVDCGLDCIANVNGTDCAQSEWSCLCQSDGYLETLSTCARQACNQTDYDTTISAVAEICAVFDNAPTINPYATATTGTENPLVSTVAIPSVGTLPSASASASSSTIDDIAGTSISTFTTSDAATGSGAAATASATTTNIAQRADLKSAALHGVAVALLGLAVYL